MEREPNNEHLAMRQECIKRIEKILEALQKSPAVKAYDLLSDFKNEVNDDAVMEDGTKVSKVIKSHPDIRLYDAVGHLLDSLKQ